MKLDKSHHLVLIGFLGLFVVILFGFGAYFFLGGFTQTPTETAKAPVLSKEEQDLNQINTDLISSQDFDTTGINNDLNDLNNLDLTGV